jgi:hypothetical protein
VQQTSGRGTFVLLLFAPGEAFPFDWSEDWAIIGGVHIKLQAAHFKLSYSRAFIIRAYLLRTHEMLFDAHTPDCDQRRCRERQDSNPHSTLGIRV